MFWLHYCLCLYAAIINDLHRAAGRSGVGTVMASKNLRADLRTHYCHFGPSGHRGTRDIRDNQTGGVYTEGLLITNKDEASQLIEADILQT